MALPMPDDREWKRALRQFRFANQTFIEPVRAQGLADVEIVSGDIHRAMGLQNAMPAVCSALGSGKFEKLADVKLVDGQGLANSSTVTDVIP